MGQLEKIDHVVVLMLENRSFDSLLGTLYPKSENFEGLSGDEFNLDAAGVRVPVWNAAGIDEVTMRIPDPDPGELWEDINTQLFGTPNVPRPAPIPAMDGFVKNYLIQKDGPQAKSIMHYFASDQVPVLSTLAKAFGVCDHWFASAPCQTWPNRWFVHTATADRRQNNNPLYLPDVDTIYNRFEEAGNEDWKIYFHDISQAKTLVKLWPLGDHFHFYSQFQADCQMDQLPAYSFIEPRYYADFSSPECDMHPPSVVTLGEQLIADVYNRIRASTLWTKTLLIITFDEHGGCYDHVPPPPAVSPEAPADGQVFNFDRYGVRVPTIIVSPYVQQGSVLRPAGDVPYDHTSIIATLRKRFGLGGPLTRRDEVAPDLESALSLQSPSNLGLPNVTANAYAPTPQTAAVAQTKSLNGMQKALVGLAANLPETPGPDIAAHAASVKTGLKNPPPDATVNVHTASTYVKQQVGNFFRSNPP
jgi:phospholipase C